MKTLIFCTVGLASLAFALPVQAQGRGGVIMKALDADGDGELSAREIANAATAVRYLDDDGDGVLSRSELGSGRRSGSPCLGPRFVGGQVNTVPADSVPPGPPTKAVLQHVHPLSSWRHLDAEPRYLAIPHEHVALARRDALDSPLDNSFFHGLQPSIRVPQGYLNHILATSQQRDK